MTIIFATRNPDKIREIQAILQGTGITLASLEDFGRIPPVVEDGATLEENALKKARAVRDATGLCALADDTGLEVDALGGEPGVHSARYAGENGDYEANNRKLLDALSGVPDGQRTARFRCVMALALARHEGEAVFERMNAEAADEAQTAGAAPSEVRGPAGDGHPAGTAVAMGSENGDRRHVPAAGKSERRIDALIAEGVLEGRITREKRGNAGFGYDPVFEVPAVGKTLAEMGLEAKNQISHRYRALVEIRELILRWRIASHM